MKTCAIPLRVSAPLRLCVKTPLSELLIGRPIRTDDDLGWVLLLLDLAGFNKFRLLRFDTFQKNACRLVVRVLRNELAANGEVENPPLERGFAIAATVNA